MQRSAKSRIIELAFPNADCSAQAELFLEQHLGAPLLE